MKTKHSKILETVLHRSQEESRRLGGIAFGVDNIFLSLLKENRGHAVKILSRMLSPGELGQIRTELEQRLREARCDDREREKARGVNYLRVENTLRNMYVEMIDSHHSSLHTGHFLMVLLRDPGNLSTALLVEHGIGYEEIRDMVRSISNDEDSHLSDTGEEAVDMDGDSDYGHSSHDDGQEPRYHHHKQQEEHREKPESAPSVLEKSGIDLTKAAAEGRIDPVVGRGKEIDRLIQILGRRKKNNPVLIGEAGVGKSAIVEGLALRITQKNVPYSLLSKRIFSLDVASLVAGTKYRGQFEERIKALLSELSRRKDVILFIDEIHTIVGAGSTQGTLDTANILKPALARGELQCIGATTLDEYRECIESDGALERRFQKIIVEPSSPGETREILQNIKEYYEDHHLVRYSDEAIEACVSLADRYLTDRYFPDKAIDIMDEAGAKARVFDTAIPDNIRDHEKKLEEIGALKKKAVSEQNFELAAILRNDESELRSVLEAARTQWEDHRDSNRIEIGCGHIEQVVSAITGIPVTRISQTEMERLGKMEENLNSAVIGQREAVSKVVRAIQRSRAGLRDPGKPIGTFMFVGPTGVGKTLLAKKLAGYLFDSEEAVIRVDMSEYAEKHNASRLIGSPPGYVGYNEGGQLTEQVRRHPYSVILFDEIEKAHSDIFNIMLQIFDEGHLTDGSGRRVDFSNSVIIMTSNAGSRDAALSDNVLGFNTSSKESIRRSTAESAYRKSLEKIFAPEFINRIDEIISFNTLSPKDIEGVVALEFSSFAERISSLGYSITMSAKARSAIAASGYEEKYGVRSIKRALTESIESPFAEKVINGEIHTGEIIAVDSDKSGAITLTVNK